MKPSIGGAADHTARHSNHTCLPACLVSVFQNLRQKTVSFALHEVAEIVGKVEEDGEMLSSEEHSCTVEIWSFRVAWNTNLDPLDYLDLC